MRTRALAFATLLLLCAAAQAQAQGLEPVLNARARGPALGNLLTQFAGLWARGDAASIAGFAARSGVSIDIDGEPIGPLSARQTAAALREVFQHLETVALRSGEAQIVGGTPERAFGEILWSVRARGTTIPETSTIFVALVWEADGWKVTQIRLLK